MNRASLQEALLVAAELERRKSGRKLSTYFPETGPLRRELYPKHLEFFGLGATKRERLFLAANRIGKTEGAGGYETTLHLTGDYPSWWSGRRFKRPVSGWAAGTTLKKTKEIIQSKLLGRPGEPSKQGTGLIPRDAIVRTSLAQGVPDGVETIWVKHVSGGISTVSLKSYDQGRSAFEGNEQDFVWLDEEPPMDIYTECLLRTMTTGGFLMLTFTPLQGMSETVLSFLPGGAVPEVQDGPKVVVSATWDDVPHLSGKDKAEILASIPPFQRDARSRGLPQLGAGVIYPVPESAIKCDPFDIPKHWPRAYGLDVGWNKTAAIFGAIDRETDTAYIYSEHYQGEGEPAVHASAIKARGNVPGAVDPASRGRSQVDGRQLIELYREQGLDITEARNAVEAGIFETWERFSTGRLKIFTTCQNTLSELRLYRRDEKGKVVKQNDHAADALRYFVTTGIGLARAPAPLKPKPDPLSPSYGMGGGSWMG